MAKYLEEEILAGDRFSLKSAQHCSTCQCLDHHNQQTYTIGTQTMTTSGGTNNALCLRCNSNLNSPSRSSAYVMRRTEEEEDQEKSSVSMSRVVEKEEKELQVNPILGHPNRRSVGSHLANGGVPGSHSNNSKSTSQSTETQLQQSRTVPYATSSAVTPASQGVNGVVRSDGDKQTTTNDTGNFNSALIKNIKVRLWIRVF